VARSPVELIVEPTPNQQLLDRRECSDDVRISSGTRQLE